LKEVAAERDREAALAAEERAEAATPQLEEQRTLGAAE
jgi:hypothetical protein